jgi:hypothetical protein
VKARMMASVIQALLLSRENQNGSRSSRKVVRGGGVGLFIQRVFHKDAVRCCTIDFIWFVQ